MANLASYEAAEAFRKAKLWKDLYEDDLFAVAQPGGALGYCFVTGHEGEHFSLGLCPGEEALQAFYAMQLGDEEDPLRQFEAMHSQDCLMCSFEKKTGLEPEDMAEIEGLGLSIPKTASAWPMFRRYRPGKMPWPIRNPVEEAMLGQALRAGVSLAAEVKRALRGIDKDDGDARERALEGLGFTADSAPLLTPREDGSFALSVIEIPQDLPMRLVAPRLEEPFLQARLKKQKVLHDALWACDVLMLPLPIEGDPPSFPTALMIMDMVGDTLLGASLVADYQEEAPQLLDKLVDLLLEMGKPAALVVDNPRAYVLLQGLAEQVGLNLRLEEEFPAMPEMRADFMAFMMQEEEPPEE